MSEYTEPPVVKAMAIRFAAALVRSGQRHATTPRQFRALCRSVIAAAHLDAAS